MGINGINYIPNGIVSKNLCFCENVVQNSNISAVNGSNDVFVRSSDNLNLYLSELGRLFPNGELYRICDNIAKEYGLEKPPLIKFETNNDNGDYMATSHLSNSVRVNLANLLAPNIYKFLVEKDGKQSYLYDDIRQRIRVLRADNQNDLVLINDFNIQQGAKSSVAVPLTDDDKRKFIISSLAHEFEHCYQNQIIRHTQGLDEFKMIETQLKNNPNVPKLGLMDEFLMHSVLKSEYNKHHTQKDLDKYYSKDSALGKQAFEWYNATVNYTNFRDDYVKYKNNPLEVDANNRAHRYLVTHYGEFFGV